MLGDRAWSWRTARAGRASATSCRPSLVISGNTQRRCNPICNPTNEEGSGLQATSRVADLIKIKEISTLCDYVANRGFESLFPDNRY